MRIRTISRLMFYVSPLVIGCMGPNTPELAERDSYLDAAFLSDAHQTRDDMSLLSDMGVVMADSQVDALIGPTQDQLKRELCGDLSYERHSLSGNLTDGWHAAGSTDFGDGNKGTCGGLGSESMIKFTAPAPGVYTLQAVTETGTLPVLYVRETCDSSTTELICTASLSQANKATLSFSSAEAEEWFIFVDTWQPSGRVQFNLTMTYAEAHNAPVINAASMLRMNSTLQIKVAAQDINADMTSGKILDENGSALFEFPFYFEEAQRANRQQVRTFNFQMPSRDTGPLYVTLADLMGLESNLVRLEDGDVINADDGDACGESVESFALCRTNSQCSPTGPDRSECVQSAPENRFITCLPSERRTSEITYSDNNADAVFGIIELLDDDQTVLEIHAFPLTALNLNVFETDRVQRVLLPPQSDSFPSMAKLIPK